VPSVVLPVSATIASRKKTSGKKQRKKKNTGPWRTLSRTVHTARNPSVTTAFPLQVIPDGVRTWTARASFASVVQKTTPRTASIAINPYAIVVPYAC
jgi:hypothetical protein